MPAPIIARCGSFLYHLLEDLQLELNLNISSRIEGVLRDL
jgi:hypothetical protein